MLLYIIFSLFAGWLFHFVHLNDFMNYLVGTSDHQYYLIWLIQGALVWIFTRITKN